MKQRIYYRIMKVTQTFPVILWLFFSSFLFATYTHAQTIKGEQSTEGITIFKLPTNCFVQSSNFKQQPTHTIVSFGLQMEMEISAIQQYLIPLIAPEKMIWTQAQILS
jgi:hypothetical protein